MRSAAVPTFTTAGALIVAVKAGTVAPLDDTVIGEPGDQPAAESSSEYAKGAVGGTAYVGLGCVTSRRSTCRERRIKPLAAHASSLLPRSRLDAVVTQALHREPGSLRGV